MTNYIITETQLADVRALVHWLCFGECRTTDRAIPTSASVARMLESIKPIEPLTNEQINQVLRDIGALSVSALDFRTIRGQQLTQPEKDDLLFDRRICRAIESHILGDTKCST